MASNLLISRRDFAVMVNVNFHTDTEPQMRLATVGGMSFIDAADYAVNANGYFQMALLCNPTWKSVELEIGNAFGTVELIEITRD